METESKNLWRCTNLRKLSLAWKGFCANGSGSNQFSKMHMFSNLELNYRFGSAKSLNFELDPGLFGFEPQFRTELW
jgi:hypothetical protein